MMQNQKKRSFHRGLEKIAGTLSRPEGLFFSAMALYSNLAYSGALVCKAKACKSLSMLPLRAW